MTFDDAIESLPASSAELARRLQDAGLSTDAVQRIVGEARRALMLETTPADEASIPLGASKLGGLPDLPRGMSWPVRPAYDDAEQLAEQYATEATNLYADAGLPPPWLAPDRAKAVVDERKRLSDEAWAGTRKLMEEAGIEVDAALEAINNLPKAGPEEIEAFASSRLATAEAVKMPFPLAFIGQFDLAALSKEEGFDPGLPSTGRLLVFYDLWILPASFEPRARAGLRLIHDETPTADLVRAALPNEFVATAGLRDSQLRAAAVATRPILTIIPTGDASWQALGLAEEEDTDLYHEWLSTLGWPTAPGGGNHQLGGWPRSIQSGMQSRSQLAANGVYAGTADAYRSPEARRLLADAKDWLLVLQIGRDEAIGLSLPGAFYVLMRGQDLSARRFDQAWIVYEQD